MFQFYEPELRCRKQKKSSEELLYQPVLFLQYRTDPWTAPLSLWSSVPVTVCHGCCRYRCRHAADQDHGVFLLCVLFYGLYDCRIPWDRKDHHPDDHYHHGLRVFRIIWIYTIFAWVHTIPALFLLYLFSWIITSIAEIIYFTVSYRKLSVR